MNDLALNSLLNEWNNMEMNETSFNSLENEWIRS